MLVVTGRIEVEAAKMGPLREAASVMVAATLAEEGCDAYRLGLGLEDGVLHLFEQWASSEALDEHFATPHFAVFSDALLDAASGPAEFTRYEIASVGPLFG